MIRECLAQVIDNKNLSFDESHRLMLTIMEGGVSEVLTSALLIALKIKGEVAEEVAGFAQAMRDKGQKIQAPAGPLIDVCGTGGDNSGTFNISTATAFVVAAAGVRVAKHGNRSISSKSGSSDVLNELGVNINLSPAASEKALQEIGLTFLFAPQYHPAMKNVAPVRSELRMKTIFNILGPLTNPAATKNQLIGTYSEHTAEIMSRAVQHLDMERVCFICSDNAMDEISLAHKTKVYEYSRSQGVSKYELSNDSFKYSSIDLKEIKGDSPRHNAAIIKELFTGNKKNAVFYVTAANAAMALYSASFDNDLLKCSRAAEEAILSGKAQQKLEQLIEFGIDQA